MKTQELYINKALPVNYFTMILSVLRQVLSNEEELEKIEQVNAEFFADETNDQDEQQTSEDPSSVSSEDSSSYTENDTDNN